MYVLNFCAYLDCYDDPIFCESFEVKPITKKYNHKKPRIGYFSGDFHDHPVLQLMMDVFKNHDKSKLDISSNPIL